MIQEYRALDSLVNHDHTEQKSVGCFMVAAYSNKDVTHRKKIETLIKKI